VAGAPAIPIISADEYLKSSYHPDREYVDGVLVERGEPTIAHALLQVILCSHLSAYRKQFHFEPLPTVRTQIVERSRYRIPDLMLCSVPLPAGKIVTSIPWVVIEMLSPDDRLSEQLARFRDYKQIGVLHMVLLDPEGLTAYRFENRALIEGPLISLELPTGGLPFDTEELFRQLMERRNEGATLS
jgi:Uma2 family endonuclease